MKVVLMADVEHLGRKGDVKEVADGYARNYLVPRRLAVPATKAQLNQIQAQSAAQARREERAQAEHRTLAQRIDATEVTVQARVGEQGRLYGSVTSADIAEQLSRALGVAIDRRTIDLPEPIKQAGSHKVRVKIGRGIEGTATVVVAAEPV